MLTGGGGSLSNSKQTGGGGRGCSCPGVESQRCATWLASTCRLITCINDACLGLGNLSRTLISDSQVVMCVFEKDEQWVSR